MFGRRKTRLDRRKRRWRRVVVGVVATPVLLLALANLWLFAPPGRNWVAGKLARSTGLQVETGPASWSPWGGVVLRDVALRLPAEAGVPGGAVDVLRVERIGVRLRWSRVLRGHLTPRKIEVLRPDANFPVEMLVALAGRHEGEAPPPPPTGEIPALAGGPESAGQGKTGMGTGKEAAAGGGTGEAESRPGASESKAAPKSAPEKAPTSWLVVRGGRFRVGMGAGRDTGLVLEEIDADIPLRGRPASGGLRIKCCRAGGVSLGSVEVPVSWEPPFLIVKQWAPDIAGVRVEVGFQAVLRGKIPFMLACAVPEDAVEIEAGGLGRVHADRAAVVARLAGYAAMPGSWQGKALADAEDVEVAGTPALQDAGLRSWKFDRCSLRAALRCAVVRIDDARAVGEDFSVLGNGLVFPNGNIDAVVRFVVPEETARAANATLDCWADAGGKRPDATPFAFVPLDTPDRWFFDARISGSIASPVLLLPGNGNRAIPLARCYQDWRPRRPSTEN